MSEKMADYEHQLKLLVNDMETRGGDALLYPKEKTKTLSMFPVWKVLDIFVAELVGTCLLVCFGCLCGVSFSGTAPPVLQVALGWGFIVSSVIVMIGHISFAHCNPSITVASIIMGRTTLKWSLVYFIAQFIGGILGYVILLVVTPQQHLCETDGSCKLCVTMVHPTVSYLQGFIVEALGTAFLVYVACGTWDKRNIVNTDSTAIKFAFAICAIVITIGPFTGAGLNPARSFPPALFTNVWDGHWVFWLGPLSGAAFAACFYRLTYLTHYNQKYHENTTSTTKGPQLQVIRSPEEASINVHRDDNQNYP